MYMQYMYSLCVIAMVLGNKPVLPGEVSYMCIYAVHVLIADMSNDVLSSINFIYMIIMKMK